MKDKRGQIYSRRPLQHIAFWEGMGFVLLVVLIWVDVCYDFSSLFFGEGVPRRWMSACALTAVTIVVGFITVANTYLQQKHELIGLLAICSYCRKIRINQEAWAHIEQFIHDKTLATFTHVICPECEPAVLEEMEAAGRLRETSSEERELTDEAESITESLPPPPAATNQR